jgi:hypothetical protein
MVSNDKLAAAAHLVIARLPPDRLGAVKLNKILWFADCEHYRRHGRSLTGEEAYVRRPQGPCPYRMEGTLRALKDRGLISESIRPVVNFTRREFTALREPDLDQFTREEIDLLLSSALEIAPMSAKAASDLSHDALWEGTDEGDLMSVEAGSVRVLPTPPEAKDWAREAFAAHAARTFNAE